MKQTTSSIFLIDFMSFVDLNEDNETRDGWGIKDGERVGAEIRAFVFNRPEVDIFSISLKGIRRLDASFPREAFTMLARDQVGKHGFFVSNVSNDVILDNIRAGADKLGFPIHAGLDDGKVAILGPSPKRTQKQLYDYVAMKRWVATSEVAEKFDLKINNASNKLKELVGEGFLLRKEGVAETGGVEFHYYPIIPTTNGN